MEQSGTRETIGAEEIKVGEDKRKRRKVKVKANKSKKFQRVRTPFGIWSLI